MILPSQVSLRAVIGGTFDTIFTIYQATAGLVWRGRWQVAVEYSVGSIVLGSNSLPYSAISASQGVDPTIDGGVHWTPIPPLNLTGYTAKFQVGPVGGVPSISLAVGTGVTLGGVLGTVSVKATPVQTAPFTAGNQEFYVELDQAGDVYYPVNGEMSFQSP